MSKEKLNNLIDKVIGKDGPLRVPAYWAGKLFKDVIEWAERDMANLRSSIPTKVGQLENDVNYVDQEELSDVEKGVYNKFNYIDYGSNFNLEPNSHTVVREASSSTVNINFNYGVNAQYSLSIQLPASSEAGMGMFFNCPYSCKNEPPRDGKRKFFTFKVYGGMAFISWAYAPEYYIRAIYKGNGDGLVTLLGNSFETAQFVSNLVIGGEYLKRKQSHAFGNTYNNTVYVRCGDIGSYFNADGEGIGAYTFQNSDLTSITLPDELKCLPRMFLANTKISELVIPDGIQLCPNIVEGCKNLTTVKFLGNISGVFSNAFDGVESLSSIHVQDIKYLLQLVNASADHSFFAPSRYNYGNCADLYIGDEKLEHLEIPSEIKKVNSILRGCGSLKSVFIPDTVEEISDNCFQICKGITSFTGKFASEDGSMLIKDGTVISLACGRNKVIIDGLDIETRLCHYMNSPNLIIEIKSANLLKSYYQSFTYAKFKKLKTYISGYYSTNYTDPSIFRSVLAEEIECFSSLVNASFDSHEAKRIILRAPLTKIPKYSIRQGPSHPGMEYIDITACTQVPSLDAHSLRPEAPTEGLKIFVKEELVEQFKVSTNWSVYADKFVGVPSDTCMNFTVDDATRLAVSGQTWEQWLGSQFFTGEYTINDGFVFAGDRNIQLDGVNVLSTDIILASAEYTVTANETETIE